MASRYTFEKSASLGYRRTEHWSVMATIEHSSNAGLCGTNRGLTNGGARIGLHFLAAAWSLAHAKRSSIPTDRCRDTASLTARHGRM
jgi:hypothetical protein